MSFDHRSSQHFPGEIQIRCCRYKEKCSPLRDNQRCAYDLSRSVGHLRPNPPTVLGAWKPGAPFLTFFCQGRDSSVVCDGDCMGANGALKIKEGLPMKKRLFRPRVLALLVLPVLLLTSVACEQERLDQFSTFATAGSQYVQAFHKLIAAAGSAAIAANSESLSDARILAARGQKVIPASEV